MRPSLLLLLVLAACSEFGLNPTDKPNGKDSQGDTLDIDTSTDSPDDSASCADLDVPAVPVALNDACDVEIQTGSFTPVAEWNLQGNNGYGPAVVGQLDDDNGDGRIDSTDHPDIVYVPNNGQGILAVDGVTKAVKWQRRTVTDSLSAASIGDVEGDGWPEIAASDGPGVVVLMDNVGNQIWRVNVNNNPPGGTLWSFVYPAFADMDNDGFSEIVVGRNIISHDGRILGTGTKGVGACPNGSNPAYLEGSVAVPVDVNHDGLLEVVTGNAIYRMDGSILYQNSLSDGTAAVADMDLDGDVEYVVNSTNTIYTLENDLSPTGWSDTFNNTNYVGPVAIDDIDGDGAPEFIAVGSGEMRAYEWNGTRKWTTAVQDSSGAAGPILFDFEMDGYPEVVYADEVHIRVFSGLDGSTKLDSADHCSATGFETPLVADVDLDGEVEIVLLHGCGAKGLTVYGDANHTWPAGRQVWNQHAYSITNVNDDLSIPANMTPNMSLYNNFRSADGGLPPSSWNDVSPEVYEVCARECPDRLVLTVRVWNQGTEEVPAGLGVVARAGLSGPAVVGAVLPDPIASGMSSPGIQLTVRTADLGGAEPWVEVDKDMKLNGFVTECVEDNNQNLITTTCSGG